MTKRVCVLVVTAAFVAWPTAASSASDFFLTIGGGDSPSANQASLENNVLFFQRMLSQRDLDHLPHDIFFADGREPEKDLQVKDVDSVPKANRLMAEFFGTEEDLGLYYRDHAVSDVRAAATANHLRHWFRDVGPTMERGDRLLLYVTAHGESSDRRDDPYNTTISLWNHQQITVRELIQLLDQLPEGVSVVTVMVQCYAGGFARLIYEGGDPDKGPSKQVRCGFFATQHDRIAAGCTPEVDESTYVEYSTFFEALAGQTRAGEPIIDPDYDGNGHVSFDEAHAYTVLKSDTIDMPIKTSGEFLGHESRFASPRHLDLLTRNPSYAAVLELAAPVERVVLEGLSEELKLSGDNRIETARQRSQPPPRSPRGRFRGRRPERREDQLRDEIADDLRRRWPELANVLNPKAVELMTTDSTTFIQAIEGHPKYKLYRDQVQKAALQPDPQKQRVKYERFVNAAENVILFENLKRLDDQPALGQYRALVAAERRGLRESASR